MPEPTPTTLPLTALLEALLFVTEEPLSHNRLAEATGATPREITTALAELTNRTNTGMVVSELNGRYQLVTAPAAAAVIRQFLQNESKAELSRAALETLAIVAYRGPITQSRTEHIRGVASGTMLRNLQTRGLITEAGKSSEPGRPILYAISHTFLQHFGLTSTSALPPLPDLQEASYED